MEGKKGNENEKRIKSRIIGRVNMNNETAIPTKSTETDVKEAIDIILSDTQAYTRSLNYAVNYCRAACRMTGHDLYVQCLYILGNITGWRHPKAKWVRGVLRNFKA